MIKKIIGKVTGVYPIVDMMGDRGIIGASISVLMNGREVSLKIQKGYDISLEVQEA